MKFKASNLITIPSVARYEQVKKKAAIAIAARYSRGNVLAQNGWFIDKNDMHELAVQGDAAIAVLNSGNDK